MASRRKDERPFHIWDESALRDLPWRYYAEAKRAINAALVLLYWLELGNSYTIYDARSGAVVRVFARKVQGVIELEPK